MSYRELVCISVPKTTVTRNSGRSRIRIVLVVSVLKFVSFGRPRKTSRDSELDPCLAWVRREQKAAAKGARFGARCMDPGQLAADTFGPHALY
jgi:hypothetical protein